MIKRKNYPSVLILKIIYEAQRETGIHIPNLVIAHDFNGDEYKFKTNDEFCKWLISKDHKDYICIAHYAKGYDSQFILKYCVENSLKPYTIYNGSKLMLLEIPSINLKIIDSSNFVQGPLSNFPETFGLTELKKGYFPHLTLKKMRIMLDQSLKKSIIAIIK